MIFVNVSLTLTAIVLLSLILYRYRLSQLLLAGFAIRLVLALTHAYYAPLPDTQNDALDFERVGIGLAHNGFEEAVRNVQPGAYSYAWFIGIVYSVLGTNIYVIMLINSFVSMLTVIYALRIAQMLAVVRRKHMIWLGLALCIHPTLALYSVIPLREAFFTFFFVFAVYNTVVYAETKRFIRLVIAGISIMPGAVLHSSLVVVYAAVGYVLYRRNRTREIAARPVVLLLAAAIAGGVLYLMYITNIGFDKLGLLAHGFDAFYERSADARTAYLTGISIDAWYDYFWQVPLRVVFFLLMPFPWVVSTAVDAFACFDALLWGGMLLTLFYRADFRKADVKTQPVLIALVLMMLVMAMGTPGYGTGIRHRAKILPIMMVATTAALSGTLSRKQSADARHHNSELERWGAAPVLS